MKRFIAMLVFCIMVLMQLVVPLSSGAATVDDTITKIEADDIVWFTGIHGHNVTEKDENGVSHTYFKYTGFGSDMLYDPHVAIKVHRTTDFFGPNTVYFYSESTLNMITDQSYDNQWKPGNTYVAQINYAGHTCNVNITIRDAILYDYTVRDNEAFITDWGDDTNRLKVLDAVIPDKIDGYTVAGIDYLGGRAHKVYSLVTSDSLRTIKPTALKDLTSLDTVYLGKSVIDISPRTFSNMTSLKEITVSSENPGYTSVGGVLYSKNVSKFVAYPLGKGKTYTLDSRATNVTNILYYDNVKFSGVNKPIELVTVDGMVYTSDKKVLVSCTSSKNEYVMPGSVEMIMPGALKKANYLTKLTISSSVEEIPEYFMEGCTRLQMIVMPASVKVVGERAFAECANLKSITWSSGLTEIGREAFVNTSLESLKLPDSVKMIGEASFESSKIKNLVVGKSLTGIENRAFAGTSLESVDLGQRVQRIGESVFEGCGSLKSVKGAESVVFMGEGAFMDCSSLEFAPIGKDQTIISKNLFSGCSSIKSVELGNKITEIGDNAFGGCNALESANIPDSVVKFGDSIFYECHSLKVASIGKHQSSVGTMMFAYCRSLETVVIPENITAIEDRAFEGCSSLKSVTMTDNIESIGIWAFEYCSSLTTIYFVGDEEGWNSIDNGSEYYTDQYNKIYLDKQDGRAVSVNGKTGFYVYGDVDMDLQITALDALAMKKYFVGIFSERDVCAEVADINLDTSINAKDILILNKSLAE